VIVTNGGGAGVLTTDACEASGLKVADPPEELKQELRRFMPEFGSAENPVDLTGVAGEEQFRGAMKVALSHQAFDCGIGLYCETAVTDPMKVAEAFLDAYETVRKPMVVAMIGGSRVDEALDFLNGEGLPSYPDVNRAVSALSALVKWSLRRRILASTYSF